MDREKGAGNTRSNNGGCAPSQLKQFCSYSPVDLVTKGHIVSTLESSGATASWPLENPSMDVVDGCCDGSYWDR